MPKPRRHPFTDILRRVGLASALVVFIALVVLLGRDGYVDTTGNEIGFLDALYYASVTATTTGYGDIAAVSDGARLAAILLITPARVLFLILVVSTTVEVLTDQTRKFIRTARWRSSVNKHIIICGFGETGQSAAADLIRRGHQSKEIIVVDTDIDNVQLATNYGYVAIHGDATHNDVLTQAAIDKAESVIVTPNRDDTSVLITLSIRELNDSVHIVAGGKEQENLHLLRQGGANEVIDASATVGRLIGLGTHAPGAVEVVDELLDAGSGLELTEVKPVTKNNVAAIPEGCNLLAVVRDGKRLAVSELNENKLQPDDRLIVVEKRTDEYEHLLKDSIK